MSFDAERIRAENTLVGSIMKQESHQWLQQGPNNEELRGHVSGGAGSLKGRIYVSVSGCSFSVCNGLLTQLIIV